MEGLELNKLYKHEIAANGVSDTGIKEIVDLIHVFLNRKQYHSCCSLADRLKEEIDWQWVTSRGTLPKRISRFLYKEAGLKLESDLMSQIGNIGRQHSADPDNKEVHYFDLTKEVCSWGRGEFEYRGSCFWTDYKLAPIALREYGAKTLRFFTEEKCNDYAKNYYEEYFSYGRAFVLTEHINGKKAYVLFNGYPEEFGLLKIARVISSYLGLSYRKIDLYGEDEDVPEQQYLYINNNSGFILGDQETCSSVSELTIDLDFDVNSVISCSSCEDIISVDLANYAEGSDGYCEECFHNNFFLCDNCKEHVHCNDSHSHNNQSLCFSCFINLSPICLRCNSHFGNTTQHKNKYLCPSCESNNRRNNSLDYFETTHINNEHTYNHLMPVKAERTCYHANQIELFEVIWNM